MGRVTRAAYTPDPAAADAYDQLYAEYRALHDHFGRGGTDVMKRLKAIRRTALAATADEPSARKGVLA
jgi:L-ribulokinase